MSRLSKHEAFRDAVDRIAPASTDYVICALDGSPILSSSAYKDAESYGDRYFHSPEEATDWDDEQVRRNSHELQEPYDYDR